MDEGPGNLTTGPIAAYRMGQPCRRGPGFQGDGARIFSDRLSYDWSRGSNHRKDMQESPASIFAISVVGNGITFKP